MPNEVRCTWTTDDELSFLSNLYSKDKRAARRVAQLILGGMRHYDGHGMQVLLEPVCDLAASILDPEFNLV